MKNIFLELHSKIAQSVSPDLVMDDLLSKKVISSDDYGRLRQVTFTRDRCRDLLSLLYSSSHPQAFIYLRLALLDEYSWIVDEIDQQIPSLTSQLQQLQVKDATDGKRLVSNIRVIFIPPPWVGGVGLLFSRDLFLSFFVSFFLCLFLCQQHYEKTAGPICTKFSGKVWSDHGTT